MNVLDENIVESQRQLLRSWRIHIRQIGHELGRAGMLDDEIIPLLRRLRQPTFFTRDLRFYDAKNRSAKYCIVCLAVGQQEAAVFVRKTLRHPALNTHAKRMGKVIRGFAPKLAIPRSSLLPRRFVRWPPLLRGEERGEVTTDPSGSTGVVKRKRRKCLQRFIVTTMR